VVLTLNEERHVAACLATLAWADDLVVLDSMVDPPTARIAAESGARVHGRRFDNYARQRQAAIDLARGDWVLFVDVDERVSNGLALEIREETRRTGPDAPMGYWIPRRNYIWGRWIRGGGWWPDAQLRLFRRDRAAYELERPVHELVQIDGQVATLRNALVHYNYETVRQFVEKQRRYAALDAGARLAAGERGHPKRLLSAPARELWRRYVTLGGRRDGAHGLALAALSAAAAADTQWRVLRASR
jgi:hypothetical protein